VNSTPDFGDFSDGREHRAIPPLPCRSMLSPTMTNNLRILIADALDRGGPTVHEALPEDFGIGLGGWTMLRETLQLLQREHPRLHIQVVASDHALQKFGLRPGVLDGDSEGGVIRCGPTDRVGAVRIVFSRRGAGHRDRIEPARREP
jgi:hypothetical protein